MKRWFVPVVVDARRPCVVPELAGCLQKAMQLLVQ